jgi:hypothetical protein
MDGSEINFVQSDQRRMDVLPRGDTNICQGSNGRRSLHGAGYQTKNQKLEKDKNMLVPKTHPLLISAIEEGTTYGYRRAHKHTEMHLVNLKSAPQSRMQSCIKSQRYLNSLTRKAPSYDYRYRCRKERRGGMGLRWETPSSRRCRTP